MADTVRIENGIFHSIRPSYVSGRRIIIYVTPKLEARQSHNSDDMNQLGGTSTKVGNC